jgi:hypothetical protein
MPVSAARGTANMTAPQVAPNTIVMDGVRDAAYGPSSIKINTIQPGNPNTTTHGEVWAAWSTTHMYFFIQVFDETPNFTTPGRFFVNDSLEMLFDWDNASALVRATPSTRITVNPVELADSEDYPITLDLNGTAIRNRQQHQWADIIKVVDAHYTAQTATGYVVEFRVNMSELGAPLQIPMGLGKQIAFEVMIADNIHGAGRDVVVLSEGYAFPSAANYQQLGGLITLGAAVPAATPPPVTGGTGGTTGTGTGAGTGTANTGTGDTVTFAVAGGLAALIAAAFTVRKRLAK